MTSTAHPNGSGTHFAADDPGLPSAPTAPPSSEPSVVHPEDEAGAGDGSNSHWQVQNNRGDGMAPHDAHNVDDRHDASDNGMHKGATDPDDKAADDNHDNKDSKLGAETAMGGATAASLADAKASLDTTEHDDTSLSHRKTYLERHPEEEHHGWSRRKKICCGLSLFLLAVLITLAVLIAFMVRMPTIDYSSSQFICPGGNYLSCVSNEVQVRVFLEVNNPNILGATINADLALYNDPRLGGQFLGPGAIGDTYVNKRGQTQLEALFNISSGETYGLLQKIFLESQEVILNVKGTVYVHVGLLRPSMQIEESFAVPPQNLGDTIGGVVGGLGDIPSPGDVIGSVGDVVGGVSTGDVAGVIGNPSVGDVAGAVGSMVPPDAPATIVGQVPGIPDSVVGAVPNFRAVIPAPTPTPTPGPNAAATATPLARRTVTSRAVRPTQQISSPSLVPASLRKEDVVVMQPRAIVAALHRVGAPGSDRRLQFEREESARRRRTPAQKKMRTRMTTVQS